MAFIFFIFSYWYRHPNRHLFIAYRLIESCQWRRCLIFFSLAHRQWTSCMWLWLCCPTDYMRWVSISTNLMFWFVKLVRWSISAMVWWSPILPYRQLFFSAIPSAFHNLSPSWRELSSHNRTATWSNHRARKAQRVGHPRFDSFLFWVRSINAWPRGVRNWEIAYSTAWSGRVWETLWGAVIFYYPTHGYRVRIFLSVTSEGILFVL